MKKIKNDEETKRVPFKIEIEIEIMMTFSMRSNNNSTNIDRFKSNIAQRNFLMKKYSFIKRNMRKLNNTSALYWPEFIAE